MKFKIFTLLLILAFRAHSFTLSNSSNVKGWANGKVTFNINTANCPSGVDVVGIIKEAIEVWNQVPTSSLKVKYGGTTTQTTDGNPIVAYCETNFQGVTGADQDSTPGVARGNGTDRLSTGLLILNASAGQSNIANISRLALLVVITHEIGHALGLGHSQSANAVMYYTYSYKTELNLSQDDIDGITYLYPSDEFDDNKFAGCGTVKNMPPPSAGKIIFLLMCLMLPLMTRRFLSKPSVFGRSENLV
jgi:Matrixin